jgi:hypothetical protein
MMGIQFGATGALQRLYVSTILGASIGDKVILVFLFEVCTESQKSPGSISQQVDFTFKDEVMLASAGGMISAVVSNPTELVMIQQQRSGGSIFKQLGSVIRNHGVLSNGLGRGLSQCFIRDGLYVAGLLGVTPALQNLLVTQHGQTEQAAGLYASVLGGAGCAYLSHPFDVVKTCMQGDLEQKGPFGKGGARGAWRGLLADGGVMRLFRGSMWRSLNIVATVYIANEIRVRASRYLGERKEKARRGSPSP